jgi:hypothetical protein
MVFRNLLFYFHIKALINVLQTFFRHRISFPFLKLGHIARMGEKRNACRLLMRKPKGKRPLGRPSRS